MAHRTPYIAHRTCTRRYLYFLATSSDFRQSQILDPISTFFFMEDPIQDPRFFVLLFFSCSGDAMIFVQLQELVHPLG